MVGKATISEGLHRGSWKTDISTDASSFLILVMHPDMYDEASRSTGTETAISTYINLELSTASESPLGCWGRIPASYQSIPCIYLFAHCSLSLVGLITPYSGQRRLLSQPLIGTN